MVLLRIGDGLAVVSVGLAVLCMMALVLLILWGTLIGQLIRYIPDFPLQLGGYWDWSAYLMGSSFLYAAAGSLRAGGHVRMSLLFGAVAPGVRIAMDAVSSVLGAGLTGFLAFSLLQGTQRAHEMNQTSMGGDVALWIPYAMLTFGMTLFCLQFVNRLLRLTAGVNAEDPRFMEPGEADTEYGVLTHD